MAMDKRFMEIFERLEAVEKALKDLTRQLQTGKAPAKVASPVTKTQLTNIKGVSAAAADKILELLNS